MHKRWVKITLAIVGLLVLILVVVPLFVNADTFRPTLQDQLSTQLGRRVTFDHLSFSLLAGSLVAQNIAIADDPAFSTSPFIQAKKLDIGVLVAPLLFQRQIHITKFTVDTPGIQLIQSRTGKWNFSSIGGSAARPASPQQPSAIPDLTVNELKIKNGSITALSLPPSVRPFVYSDVNVTVKDFSFAKSFPFELSARLPANGTLTLTGSAGPLSAKDAADTPFRATLQITHLDPVAAGLIDRGKGISMIGDIDAQVASDGTTASSTGKLKAAQLQLAASGSPALQPVNIDYQVSDDLDGRTGRVTDVALHTGAVAAHLSGTFRFSPDAVVLDLRLAAPSLPIDQLETLLPVVGIHLPSGSSLQGGTLSATASITGPATAVTINGPVEIDNTKLAGFDLGSRIEGLNPFGGTGKGTEIQVLRAKLNSSPQNTQITDIYGNLPQMGSATGSGTVAPSGAINFNMVATLSANNVMGTMANTATNAVNNLVGGFLGRKPAATPNSPRGIPLIITGTAEKPSIRANIGAMLR